ncbi:restriction endonuclease subunit S [Pseudomonas sp. RIT288]|uniref:restriction endonuclease subunit S n=1 Tax=Pseudomonas sp. RIT288 TaxID=1470589 RepID=UPI00044AEDA6|nr:restriction endonuclease subunit S [Pseudomonas sp. RIT288]EZP31293.1 type I restriction-modification system specificity subunit [Pseudomonas sp. RIT288]
MSDLPEGWIEVDFKDVAEVNPRKSVHLNSDDAVTFVPMAAVSEQIGAITDGVVRTLKEVNKGFTQFAEEDVIFAKITPSMENGKSAVAVGLKNGIGFGSTEFHVLRSNGAVMPKYLWYFIRQKRFREDAQKVMSGAVGQQRVPADYLKNCKLPLPPLSEQKKIIDRIDGLIARTNQARNDLDVLPGLVDSYKKRLLSLAYTGHLLKGSVGAFQSSPQKMANLSTFVESLRYGTAQKSVVEKVGVPVLRIPNVVSGKIDLHDLKYSDLSEKELDTLKLTAGDILVVRSNGSTSLVGRPAVVSNEALGMAYAGYLIRLRPLLSKVVPEFLALMLQAPEVRGVIEAGARSTSGVHNINAKELGSLAIPLFSLEDQVEIVSRVESTLAWLERVLSEHNAMMELLPKLDAAILSKAFRGDLVSQERGDESALALLARIRAEREIAPKRQTQMRTKDKTLIKDPKDRLLLDSHDWPDEGLPFAEVAKRVPLPYDEMRDAIFKLLAEDRPQLRQVFNNEAACMHLQRVKV